jgi:hypothetical protein
MFKYDLIYIFAYIIFLVGAAMSFRRKRYSFRIMSMAVLIDFFAVTVPFSGFKSLAISVETDTLIIIGTITEVLVWVLFVSAMFSRAMERKMIFSFDGMISVTKVLWFINLVTIFYGVYDL